MSTWLDKREPGSIMDSILDAQLFQWIYGWLHRPPWLLAMSWLTHLGDSKVVLSLAALGMAESAVAWGRLASRHETKQRPPPLIPWLGIPVAVLLTGWLKQLVGRPRPAEVIPTLGFLQNTRGDSFPSGHATLAFALAGALSFRWPRGRCWWFGLASLVAVSRVALGVHWPSDVVAGAGIGVGVVVSFMWVEQRVRFINNLEGGIKKMKSRMLWMVGILIVAVALVPAVGFAAEHGGATSAPAKEHGGAAPVPAKEHGGAATAPGEAPTASVAPVPAPAPDAATPTATPAPPALKPIVITFGGELSTVDAKSTPAMITVQDRYGVKKEISVPAEAKIAQGTAAKTLAELKVGDKLTVEYTYDVATGKRTAQSITIGEAAPTAQ